MKFPEKFWRMVNDNRCRGLTWKKDTENVIRIDPEEFIKSIQNDDVFRTRNFSSMVRQLNMYGFKRVRNRANSAYVEFSHSIFRRECYDKLKLIQRRSGAKSSGPRIIKSRKITRRKKATATKRKKSTVPVTSKVPRKRVARKAPRLQATRACYPIEALRRSTRSCTKSQTASMNVNPPTNRRPTEYRKKRETMPFRSTLPVPLYHGRLKLKTKEDTTLGEEIRLRQNRSVPNRDQIKPPAKFDSKILCQIPLSAISGFSSQSRMKETPTTDYHVKKEMIAQVPTSFHKSVDLAEDSTEIIDLTGIDDSENDENWLPTVNFKTIPKSCSFNVDDSDHNYVSSGKPSTNSESKFPASSGGVVFQELSRNTCHQPALLNREGTNFKIPSSRNANCSPNTGERLPDFKRTSSLEDVPPDKESFTVAPVLQDGVPNLTKLVFRRSAGIPTILKVENINNNNNTVSNSLQFDRSEQANVVDSKTGMKYTVVKQFIIGDPIKLDSSTNTTSFKRIDPGLSQNCQSVANSRYLMKSPIRSYGRSPCQSPPARVNSPSPKPIFYTSPPKVPIYNDVMLSSTLMPSVKRKKDMMIDASDSWDSIVKKCQFHIEAKLAQQEPTTLYSAYRSTQHTVGININSWIPLKVDQTSEFQEKVDEFSVGQMTW